MSLINVIDACYYAGEKCLFENISFSIDRGDRIGLVGHNGCGKSSLLRLLTGEIMPDGGRIHRQRGLNISTVEQFIPGNMLCETAHDAVIQLLPEEALTTRSHEVDRLLSSLGFSEDQQQQQTSTLSGGQQNLVLLARALITMPDLLLLDEPSNHMDVLALDKLRFILQSDYTPSFVIISHDRDLLDITTHKTLWLRDQTLYHFALPYTQSKTALAALDESAARRNSAEQKTIDQLTLSAKRIANWGKTYDNEDFARKAKSMEKRIEKLKTQQTKVTQEAALKLTVDMEMLQAKQLFTMERATITTPAQSTLFSVEYLTFRPGDRVALLGVNGSGKSTCITALMAHHAQPYDQQTNIRFNPRVKIGYFDQHLTQFTTNASVFSWLRDHTNAEGPSIKHCLIQWGFPYEMHQTPISKLSGGQRARLALLGFQLDQPNLLIMDEPTNHLDLQGKEALETDLQQPGISLLFTAHDRRFVEKVATRYWWINNGRLTEIHSLDTFYDSLCPAASQPSAAVAKNTTQTANANKVSLDATSAKPTPGDIMLAPATSKVKTPKTEDEILETIIELETLLASDLARKKKCQKPKQQAKWKAEIEMWSEILDKL